MQFQAQKCLGIFFFPKQFTVGFSLRKKKAGRVSRACPPLVRLVSAACPPLVRLVSATCPPLVRHLSAACPPCVVPLANSVLPQTVYCGVPLKSVLAYFLTRMESMTYVALLPIQSQYVPVYMGVHFFLVLMRSITLTHCCSLLVENTFRGPFVRVARKNTTAVLKHMQSSTVLRPGLSRFFEIPRNKRKRSRRVAEPVKFGFS